MKILMLAPYVYRDDIPLFSKHKSGFGMMVNDIAFHISRTGNEVRMLTNSFTKEENVGYTIAKHSLCGFFCSFRLRGLLKYLKDNKIRVRISSAFARQAYYYLNSGFVKKFIKK